MIESICILDYKKSSTSDHIRSVKQREKLGQYYCKKCNSYMPLPDKDSHLKSDKLKSEIHLRSQQNDHLY